MMTILEIITCQQRLDLSFSVIQKIGKRSLYDSFPLPDNVDFSPSDNRCVRNS
jgi:hypothetical protein